MNEFLSAELEPDEYAEGSYANTSVIFNETPKGVGLQNLLDVQDTLKEVGHVLTELAENKELTLLEVLNRLASYQWLLDSAAVAIAREQKKTKR